MFRPDFLLPSRLQWMCKKLVDVQTCTWGRMLHPPTWNQVAGFIYSLCASLQNSGGGRIKSHSRKQSFDVLVCGKILLSSSASLYTGQSVPAAARDLSPASAPLVLKRARSSCVQKWSFCLVSTNIKMRIASYCWALVELLACLYPLSRVVTISDRTYLSMLLFSLVSCSKFSWVYQQYWFFPLPLPCICFSRVKCHGVTCFVSFLFFPSKIRLAQRHECRRGSIHATNIHKISKPQGCR